MLVVMRGERVDDEAEGKRKRRALCLLLLQPLLS